MRQHTGALARIGEYAALTRQGAPIGWLLLLFPTLAALIVSASDWPSIGTLLIFTLGVWLTRSAGCVINDYADRHLDPKVARTRHRPLAAGRITPAEALVLFVCLMTCAALLLLLLTPAAAFTAMLGAPLILLYPYAKRVTTLPQIVLGVTFSWGIPVASAEVSGGISEAALWLFAANFLWVLAYDTFYALQDLPDDQQAGVGSLATRFGITGSLRLIALCQLGMLVLLVSMGLRLGYAWPYHASLFAIGLLFVWQHLVPGKEVHRERMGYLRAFRHNGWVGALLLASLALEKLVW